MEASLASGFIFKEWDEVKLNPEAHKEFIRLQKCFKAIKHNDLLHENTVNRYCLLHAECKEYAVLKNKILRSLEMLDEKYAEGSMEFMDYVQEQGKLQDKLMACDRKVMDKRKMMLDLEKENVMTIASALRAIPKKPDEKKDVDPMAKLLGM